MAAGLVRALSLWQPWASLVARGHKRVETRSWTTSYRGPLAIHAAAKLTPLDLWPEGPAARRAWFDLMGLGPGFGPDRPAGPEPPVIVEPADVRSFLRRGVVLATCSLLDVLEIGRGNWGAVTLGGAVPGDWFEPERELSFGDYAPGRYAWVLSDVRRLPAPVPERGRQGLWEWAAE